MRIDWRAEMARSEARVVRAEKAIGDAKAHLRTLEKDLEKARKADRETRRAFIDGRQNLPLFDAAEPSEAPAEKAEPDQVVGTHAVGVERSVPAAPEGTPEGWYVEPLRGGPFLGRVVAAGEGHALDVAKDQWPDVEGGLLVRRVSEIAAAVERARAVREDLKLLGAPGDSARSEAMLRAGAPVFAEGPEYGVFDADGKAVLTEAGAQAFGQALREAVDGPGLELEFTAQQPGGREVMTAGEKREVEEAMSAIAGGPMKLTLIDAGTRERRPTDSDAQASLRAALHRVQGCESRWAAAIENGEDDAALLTTIAQEFGPTGVGAADGVGYRVQGGKAPKFWVGFGATGKPDLQGKALVQAVRELMGVPLPYGKQPPKPRKTTAKLAGASKVPTATVEAPDEAERVGCRKAEPTAAPTWRDANVGHLRALTPAQTTELKKFGIETVGALADAVAKGYICRPEGMSTKAYTEAEVALREHFRTASDGPSPEPTTAPALIGQYKVGPVFYHVGGGPFPDYKPPKPEAEREPGAPVRTMPEAARTRLDDQAAARRRAELTDAYLAEALWPADRKTRWNELRKAGAANGEIAAELLNLWPRLHTHVEGSPGEPGYTIVGGGWPVFWLGSQVAGPNRPTVLPPGLHGPELMDAIRRVLRIPDAGGPGLDLAEAAAEAKAKKSRKKGAKV